MTAGLDPWRRLLGILSSNNGGRATDHEQKHSEVTQEPHTHLSIKSPRRMPMYATSWNS